MLATIFEKVYLVSHETPMRLPNVSLKYMFELELTKLQK